MNYRHIYHAGNFADVLKHAVLARIVEYLKGKEKAFRVIDTGRHWGERGGRAGVAMLLGAGLCSDGNSSGMCHAR